MKIFCLLSLIFIISANLFAQENTDLKKLVETEKSFASTAASRGTRAAFLEFLADDGIVFNPTAINGKELWGKRPESASLLAWNPAYADISSNGALGYTTGDWQFYPKGKSESAAAFGQYFTIWQKQAGGNYKAVLDLGISHPKPPSTVTDWKSPAIVSPNPDTRKSSATAAAQLFFETAESIGLAKAYKTFAAEDIRILREENLPVTGKKDGLELLKKDKGAVRFSKRMFFVGAGDLAYLSDVYTITKTDKTTIKGNLAQVWKLRGGDWQIVMDVWNRIPVEKK